MPSMDKMKRFTGFSLLNRSKSQAVRSNTSGNQRSSTFNFANNHDPPAVDSPEANAARSIRLFCESGSASNGGEEVLHLPVIVESAESSPTAAAQAAQQIRVFLTKEWHAKPYVQYNAIMLIRILSDNPGATFTRNFDKSFVNAVKELLRTCKDDNVQQILRETLDALEVDKQSDEGLSGLLTMWRKEKGHGASLGGPSRNPRHSQWQQPAANWQNQRLQQTSLRGGAARTRLPAPAELASRVEEAKNTAKILLQLVQSTPSEEVLNNELLREFSERCQGASRSMQSYINCDSPAPDHDTMQTLIETNEQLSLALSRHQRAVLAARRALGVSPSPNNAAATENGHGAFAPPGAVPSSQQQYNYTSVYSLPAQQPQSQTNGFGQQLYDDHETYHSPQGAQGASQQPSPPLPNNPFADPIDHSDRPSPYSMESSSNQYNAFGAPVAPHIQQQSGINSAPQHRTQPSQTFTIEPEVIQPPTLKRETTQELEDVYSVSSGRPSPILNRSAPAAAEVSGSSPPSPRFVSPHSPPRPGPAPWHTSDVTPSFMGRQQSAMNGLTMHGGVSDENVQEIDGHSQVGRTMTTRGTNAIVSPVREESVSPIRDGGSASASVGRDVSPVETRQQGRRVDVAGTGGFKSY